MGLKAVYEYYADDLWRYAYSTSPEPSPGWKKGGIVFYAADQGEPGTLPIYGHYAEDPWRFWYSTEQLAGNGWKNGAAEFNAWAKPANGLVPVYLYYATDPWRYMLSTKDNFGYGWTREKILFYALPAKPGIILTDAKVEYKAPLSVPEIRPELFDERTIENETNSTVTEQVSMTQNLSSVFTWALTDATQIEFGDADKLDINFDVPKLFGGDASFQHELKTRLEAGKIKEWSRTKEMTFSINQTVAVKENSSVKVQGYVGRRDNVAVPFDMILTYESANKREVLDPRLIFDIFQEQNPQVKEYEAKDGNKAIIRLSGTFTGSAGVGTELKVTPL